MHSCSSQPSVANAVIQDLDGGEHPTDRQGAVVSNVRKLAQDATKEGDGWFVGGEERFEEGERVWTVYERVGNIGADDLATTWQEPQARLIALAPDLAVTGADAVDALRLARTTLVVSRNHSPTSETVVAIDAALAAWALVEQRAGETG